MIDLKKVMKFAMNAHKDQMYGDFPYSTHLSDVYATAKEFGITDPDILAACWLHDVIEDTEHNYNDVKKLAGESVAEIVYAVTDELGRNRKERHLKTWPKVRKLEGAFLLKMCDMIANVRMGIKEVAYKPGGQRTMYQEEYPAFCEEFNSYRGYPEATELWNELDKLLKPVGDHV